MKKQINEIKRMQLIAGLITESEYRQSLNEAETPSDIEEFLDGMINDSIPEDSEEGEEVKGVWEADEYADEESYGEAAQEFKNTHKYIMDHGGKITVEGNPDVTYKALPNGDIAYRLIVTLDEAKKMDEAEDTLSSFKSLDQMNDYLEKGGWDPYEVADEKAEKKGLMLINKYIKSNILDKGKTLSPNKLNALLIKIEDLLP